MVLLAKVWSGNTALDNLTPFNSIPLKNRALLLTWKCSISLTVWRDANKAIPGARTADCKNKCLKAPTVEEVDVLQFSLYFFPPLSFQISAFLSFPRREAFEVCVSGRSERSHLEKVTDTSKLPSLLLEETSVKMTLSRTQSINTIAQTASKSFLSYFYFSFTSLLLLLFFYSLPF